MQIEALSDSLSRLYCNYGYLPYAMSKFEEYELYLRNKDFLVSDRILTFTDTDGRLMALKPDVTLSIIKNTAGSSDGLQKLYYREHVYRPGKNDQGFREIMQIGLECMGQIDTYCIFEVLLLAIKSLKMISNSCVLDLSHMGLVTRLLDQAGLNDAARKQALDLIGNKNVHELRKLCAEAGAEADKLVRLAQLSGKAAAVLSELDEIFGSAPELLQLKRLLNALDKTGVDCVNVDFSVVNDMNYYNGIVFRGFVEGVPEGILSGGQYDSLMRKMKRTEKAIGFAIYPDLLERMATRSVEKVDTILFYDEDEDLSVIADAVASLAKQGVCVSAQPYQENRCSENYYRLIEQKTVLIEKKANSK